MRLAPTLFGVALVVATTTEVSAASRGASFIDSSVCMTGPTLVAIIMTPTAKLGEGLSNLVDRRLNGGGK